MLTAVYMVSRMEPRRSDLGSCRWDRVNPGMCLIPYRSCSHARVDSCRLIFLCTVPNLTHGNLDKITCKGKKCLCLFMSSLSMIYFFNRFNLTSSSCWMKLKWGMSGFGGRDTWRKSSSPEPRESKQRTKATLSCRRLDSV